MVVVVPSDSLATDEVVGCAVVVVGRTVVVVTTGAGTTVTIALPR